MMLSGTTFLFTGYLLSFSRMFKVFSSFERLLPENRGHAQVTTGIFSFSFLVQRISFLPLSAKASVSSSVGGRKDVTNS